MAVKAQYFPAAQPNQLATTTRAVTNMGNDAINYANNGVNETMRTIVYDGDTPGMFFEFRQGGVSVNTGVHFLSFSDAIDPDVALIARNISGTWRVFALVSYARASGGIYLELWRFNAGTQTFTLFQLNNIGTTSTAQLRAAVNVDSDQQDRFAVTWDEQGGNGDVFVYGGYMNGAGTFVFSPGPVALQLPAVCGAQTPGVIQLQPLSQPDVAVFSAGGTGGIVNCIVNVCYLDVTGDLHVAVERFLDIINGTSNGGIAFCVDATNGDVYNKPRIACQRYNAAVSLAQTGVSVVYEVFNPGNNTSNIGSTTTYIDLSSGGVSGFINSYILTDGTYQLVQPNTSPGFATFIDIGNFPYQNTGPVVTYNRKSGSFNPTDPILLVAWNTFDGNFNVPVCLLQLANGSGLDLQLPGIFPPAYAGDYLEIPFNPSREEGIVSISGEQTNTMLYSWYDLGSQEVRYKARSHGLPLRLESANNSGLNAHIHDHVLQVSSDQAQASSPILMRIYSANGAELYSGSLPAPAVFDLKQVLSAQGLYVVVLNSDTNQLTLKYAR